jgi:Trypsin-like peptidase domain
MQRARLRWIVVGMLALERGANADSLVEASRPLVYGHDDRQEYFEVADARARSVIKESVVALVSKRQLAALDEPFPPSTPTWADVDQLCPDEPFRDQPAGAFCTGVLVDWDLVLTAGHCVRLFTLQDTAVVFDYYYEAPGKIAARKEDTRGVVEIVAEALDGPSVEPRLDYAWLRLANDAGPARRPAAVYVAPPFLNLGDSIVSMGAGGGVPIKFDAGGRIRNLRESSADYFVADVDTSRGSSGAGAFNQDFALLGILARGGLDFVQRGNGCRVTNRVSEELATEQFTYAHRAVSALCAKNPRASSICRSQCGEPCRALPLPPSPDGGCSVARSVPPSDVPVAMLLVMSVAAGLAVRLRSVNARRISAALFPASVACRSPASPNPPWHSR